MLWVYVFLGGSQNKQRFFPYEILSDGSYNRDGVCLLRGSNLIFVLCRLISS
jgi:hypothetical protein